MSHGHIQPSSKKFIPRLGAMHILMNFRGAVGEFMSDTGLETMLQAAFGGVSPCYQVKSSLSTALRHLTKEFLCEVIFKKEARLMVRWQYWKTRERPIAHQSFGREPDLCNAIWSDIYIESTFMRYGHSPGGIIGITVKPSTLKRWALSLHLCT